MILVGIQEEVTALLKPFHDRVKIQEKVVEDMTEQLTTIMKELDVLRATVRYQSEDPALPDQQHDHGML